MKLDPNLTKPWKKCKPWYMLTNICHGEEVANFWENFEIGAVHIRPVDFFLALETLGFQTCKTALASNPNEGSTPPPISSATTAWRSTRGSLPLASKRASYASRPAMSWWAVLGSSPSAKAYVFLSPSYNGFCSNSNCFFSFFLTCS